MNCCWTECWKWKNQKYQDNSNMLQEEWLSINSQQRTEEISVEVI